MTDIIKNPRRIFSAPGGDPSLPNRVTTLENNEYKILYFQTISAATGTITKPTNSTILLDQFYEGGDAIVETLVNSQPSGQSPLTAGGAVVSVSSFDTSGNFTLSGTPSSFDVALVYILKIKAVDYSNLTIANIMAMEDLVIYNERFTVGATATNLAQNSTYSMGQNLNLSASATTVARAFGFEHDGTLDEVILFISTGNLSSTELATLELRNVTASTSQTIGTFTYDAGVNGNKVFRFSALGLAVNSTDIYSIQSKTATTMVTAPTNVYHAIRLKTNY